jgi:hypothetical protein
MWYDTFGCPQLTADAYRRPVVLLASSPKVFANKNSNRSSIEYNKSRMTFVPFFDLDTEVISDPIIVFLAGSHFYLVERQIDVVTKKSFAFEDWPAINPMHETVIQTHRMLAPAIFPAVIKLNDLILSFPYE